MKVCIVTYDEYLNIPYVKLYERILTKLSIQYDLILWNRSGVKGDVSASAENNFIFDCKTKSSKMSKLLPFIRWRRFAKGILQRGNYGGIIVCTTIPGMLIWDLLASKFKGRFLLDIRDYTYESFCLYGKIEKSVLEKAGLVVVSSESFKEWLPARGNEAAVVHNIDNAQYEVTSAEDLSLKSKISISFVGGVRYFDINKKVISIFSNKPKYQLSFIGKRHPGCDLQKFCVDGGIANVAFGERYHNDQKPTIYRSIDLINSIYGDSSLEVRSALPNKLYDCALFKKPIIVSKNTYVQTIVEKYNLGIAVDVNNDDVFAETERYVSNFSCEEFMDGCRGFLRLAIGEQTEAEERIEDFLIQLLESEGKFEADKSDERFRHTPGGGENVPAC